MKLMMKFCLCLHKFSELWNLFSLVPMGNCFWCYFRQLFMYLALRKCKNDCEILKIILVPDFCPLKPEIARFSIGFRLKYWESLVYTVWSATRGELINSRKLWGVLMNSMTSLFLRTEDVSNPSPYVNLAKNRRSREWWGEVDFLLSL